MIKVVSQKDAVYILRLPLLICILLLIIFPYVGLGESPTPLSHIYI